MPDDKSYRSPIKILSEVQSNQLLSSDQNSHVYLNNGGQVGSRVCTHVHFCLLLVSFLGCLT